MINKVHERALRVLLNDHESDLETMMFVTNAEIFRHFWLKSSKLKKVLLLW